MTGKGSEGRNLGEEEVRDLCAEFVERQGLRGRRVLGVIPDHTRSAPIDLMFRTMAGLLGQQGGAFDILIALGTHPPMSDEAIDRRLGLKPGERASRYPRTQIFNHRWKDPAHLRHVGTISADEVALLSRGMMREAVDVSINTLVFSYDTVLIIGPTFPHEVVGFSGGNKYLFPGISGQEIIDMFHWLGALITNPVIIGRKETPVRRVVDAAAAMLPVQRLCMSLVVRESGLAGLFCGTPEEAWSAAADLSAKVHIVIKDRPFERVLSCAPPMYDELWGGELTIFAPHIREISVTHGAFIERVGYHVRDYFRTQMDRFRDVPKGVLAHSTHVKGIGTFEGGKELPRISVVLATGIPEETCTRINLGYRDPKTIDPREYQGREEEGILHVPKAGEMLYRLRDDPFAAA